MGKWDLYTLFKQDWMKLVGVFQNQLYVCVVLSEPDVANKCVFILKVLVTSPVWKTSWYYKKLQNTVRGMGLVNSDKVIPEWTGLRMKEWLT